MWCVYRHISPSEKVYIGITTNIKIRWSRNGARYTTYNSIFKRVIEKYGWDNIRHEILFSNLDEQKAKLLEIKFIRHYKNLEMSYNITDGGNGTTGRVCSEETKAKMRLSNKGVCELAYINSKNSEKKRLQCIENIKKAHLANTGQVRSLETIEKMKSAAKGRNMDAARIASIEKIREPVVAIDRDNNSFVFNSMKEAGDALNTTSSNIGRAIKRNIKANGYKFYKIKENVDARTEQ